VPHPLDQLSFVSMSSLAPYLLLGMTFSAVSTLVALRARHALLLGWAVVWMTQPLALTLSRELFARDGAAYSMLWAAVIIGLHNAALVMSAWSQARGDRSFTARDIVLALLIVASSAIAALCPRVWAESILGLAPAVSCMIASVLLRLNDDAGRGTGLRLAAYSLIFLGLCLFGEFVLRNAAYSTLAPASLAVVPTAAGFVLMVLAFAGLFIARTEGVERTLSTVHARLDELRRRLGDAAATDPLTGFFNRRAFRDLVDHVRMGTATSQGFVLVLDMDGLKRINDTQGHSIGDKAIYRTARATESSLRVGDIPIRWGGDEFVVVLPGTDLDQAEDVQKTIQIAIQQTGLSASIGLSAYGPARDIVIALREADRLMYVAKRRRRDARRVPATQLQLPLEKQLDAAPTDVS
jgi:diguanylate cyclase (GGDEF)-like protein